MTATLSLVSWNITRRCNLRCSHCYLDADARASGEGELTTAEGLRFIEQLGDLCPGAMLIFSGGEPLLRADLLDLISHAARRGLLPVLGTNGVLLSDEQARRLAAAGLAGVGLSLDSLNPERHDAFRGLPGAWRKTVAAMAACRRHGLAVQIHATATRDNYGEIPALIAFAAGQGAVAFNLFFLVCTGRGQQMIDITPAQYEESLIALVAAQDKYRGRMLIRARCAPHFRRLVHAQSLNLAAATAGCMAGTAYCRVTPEGEVTPCPYLPLVAGNLRSDSLADIWHTALVFRRLRQPDLRGRCGACEFAVLCGGCRARAFAASGDLMAEDPWCDYQPGISAPSLVASPDLPPGSGPEWAAEARSRLARVPSALRPMVEKAAESYARSKGLTVITPELMAELRAKGSRMSHFSR
ncbi:MAG: radical SAM protein, partial [Anaerolineae bacterium]